jgi:hypothetical protein
MSEYAKILKPRPYFKILLAALFALCFLRFPAYAAKIYPAAGTTSAAFLKLGVGARAVAMGGAFTGIADDPFAIYWNPAGLASLEGERNLGFFHNDYIQGLGQEFLLYTSPAEGIKFLKSRELRSGVWGLGLDYFYTPKDLERRSGLNEGDSLSPISPVEGKFGAYDLAFLAGYGWRRSKDLSLGGALKVIRQSIDDKSGSSLALDLGLLRDFSWRGDDFTAGFAVQNIGPGVKFISRRYDLPLVFKAGLSRRLPDSGALVSLEADKSIDNYPFFVIGMEYPLMTRLALRAGYRYRLYGNELGPWSGISAGAGIAFERFSFDYAFNPFGDLGNSHRFSLNIRFGRSGAAAFKSFQAAAPAEGLMENAKVVSYSVSPKALLISQRGMKYEIKAVSADSDLYAFSFKTLVRSAVPAELSMTEGGLPASLRSRLPEGVKPINAWQFGPSLGNIQGNIAFELKAAKTGAEKPGCEFFYLDKAGWKEAGVAKTGEDAGYYYFSVSAPLSSHYAIAPVR